MRISAAQKTGGRAVAIAIVMASLAVFVSVALAAQDRYTLKVPNGLSFSEFRGYEDWQVVAPSQTDAPTSMTRCDLGESRDDEGPVQEVAPANGNPFPDGSKITKVEWQPKKITDPLCP